MSQILDHNAVEHVQVINASGSSAVVLVCEHASATIPDDLNNLGLDPVARQSHIAWDPGALAVTLAMTKALDAAAVVSGVSRLVYDCNRSPAAPDAMPARSEVFDIPGNAALTDADRAQRVQKYYEPFRDALATRIAKTGGPVVVTIHSFTPIYHDVPRQVEIGVLHDADTRLADAMLACATDHTNLDVQRNAPYGPGDGVTHTLCEHALPGGHLNVMLEVRNDLLTTPAAQKSIAHMLARWVTDAFGRTGAKGAVTCSA